MKNSRLCGPCHSERMRGICCGNALTNSRSLASARDDKHPVVVHFLGELLRIGRYGQVEFVFSKTPFSATRPATTDRGFRNDHLLRLRPPDFDLERALPFIWALDTPTIVVNSRAKCSGTHSGPQTDVAGVAG